MRSYLEANYTIKREKYKGKNRRYRGIKVVILVLVVVLMRVVNLVCPELLIW